MLVANDISAPDAGFDVETNRVLMLDAHGTASQEIAASKAKISELIVQRVAALLNTLQDETQ